MTLGPGYFTGLRIGVATAQGLALALDLPCCGVSSLRLLAQGAAGFSGNLWAVADARRGLVYAACFKSRKNRMAPGSWRIRRSLLPGWPA